MLARDFRRLALFSEERGACVALRSKGDHWRLALGHYEKIAALMQTLPTRPTHWHPPVRVSVSGYGTGRFIYSRSRNSLHTCLHASTLM